MLLLALNFEERGFEESDIPLVAYGDMLFDSPEIFGDPGRSLGITCSTCHNRSDINNSFFIPGSAISQARPMSMGHFSIRILMTSAAIHSIFLHYEEFVLPGRMVVMAALVACVNLPAMSSLTNLEVKNPPHLCWMHWWRTS